MTIIINGQPILLWKQVLYKNYHTNNKFFISEDLDYNAFDEAPSLESTDIPSENKRKSDTDRSTKKLNTSTDDTPPAVGKATKRPAAIDNQDSGKKKPLSPSTSATSVRAADTTSETSTEQPMQIDAPEGNLANQKGSVSGESGSRKQQKLSYFWGDIQVHKMNENTYTFVHLFKNSEDASDFFDLVDTVYSNAELHNFVHKGMSSRQLDNGQWIGFDSELKSYVVCVTLPFHIGLATYYEKFNRACKSSQCFHVKILGSMDDPEDKSEFEDVTKCKLKVFFKNDIFGIDWLREIEKHKEKKSFNKAPGSKKRKCTFD